MRYLILTQYFPPEMGAAQVRLAAFLKELQRNGHTVEVVTAMPHQHAGRVFPGYQSKAYVRDTYHGATVHRTWVYAAAGVGFGRLFNYLSFALTCLFGLFKSEKPDFLFVESPPPFLGLPGVIYSKVKKVPLIFFVADLWPDAARELGLIKNGVVLKIAEWFEHFVYAHSKYVAAATAGIVSVLVEKKGLPRSKVFLLPNGVDADVVAPLAPDADLVKQLDLADKKVFLYAGTHGVCHGLETVIEAARLLESTNIAIVFVGDGSKKAGLVARAREYGLSNVRFVDSQPIEEMSRYHSLAVASLSPVRKLELFKATRPAKVFTSLACGVPVIYGGEGETAEFVREANVGLAVDPENPIELADAIRLLARDESAREQMARNARRLAVERFGWERIVREWLDELASAESANGPVQKTQGDLSSGGPVGVVNK
jgi:glycosyltransferase involved in cell wall biosynthesis